MSRPSRIAQLNIEDRAVRARAAETAPWVDANSATLAEIWRRVICGIGGSGPPNCTKQIKWLEQYSQFCTLP
jgi:hypothetical protein